MSAHEVVERLAHGPATVAVATGGLGVSKPAISKHLKVLEEGGVIVRTVEGGGRVAGPAAGGLGADVRRRRGAAARAVRDDRRPLVTGGWTTPVAEVDLRLGGRLRLVVRDPAGSEFSWPWDGPSLGADEQLVEVGFTANAAGDTTVVLVNHGLDDEAARSHEEGWQLSFDTLDQVLAVHTRGAAR